jgi:ubiquinone/menaquinone biosynthesis C-methylase UbiE
MLEHDYNPRDHWEHVASEVAKRRPGNVVAGDDSPFHRYLRARFLADFRTVSRDFKGIKVLELGCGPGGNLIEASLSKPAWLVGCDISAGMLGLAAQNLANVDSATKLCRIDGSHIPFAARAFDVSFTVTVLQHVTAQATFHSLLAELARITSSRVLLYEDTNSWRREKFSHVARRVATYRSEMAEHGFSLSEVRHLSTAVSHVAISALRRLVTRRDRSEGDPFPELMLRVQATMLKFTKVFDRMLPAPVGLTRMVFERRQPV